MTTAVLHLDASAQSSIVSMSLLHMFVSSNVGAVFITVSLCVEIGAGPSLIFLSKYILLCLRRSSSHSSMLIPYVLCSHSESVRSVCTGFNVIGPFICISPQIGRLSWTGKCSSDSVGTVVCLCEVRWGTPMFQWISIGSQYPILTCKLIWNPILAGVCAPLSRIGHSASSPIPVRLLYPFPLMLNLTRAYLCVNLSCFPMITGVHYDPSKLNFNY